MNRVVRLGLLLLAGLLFTTIARPGLSADVIYADAEVVEFESVPFTYQPSPFKIKQAQKLGIPLQENIEPPVALFGYLQRPAVAEARPAIVLMHTCAGLSEHEEWWSNTLASWGYVVLSVDSFKPRGYQYVCDSREGLKASVWNRALDAYGARQYLAQQDFVDPERIAIIGMSHGGMTVMETIKTSLIDGLDMPPFKAAIALYPLCSEPAPIKVPTLILIGSADSWTPAILCEQYLAKSPAPESLQLQVFADAHHGFDHPGIDIIDAGYVVRSHPAAAAEAMSMIQQFLESHF